MKHKMDGYIDYPKKGRISDEDVYRLIVNHSRLIDRMSGRKMTEMALCGQCVLMGLFEEDGYKADDSKWKFYGKNGFFKNN